VANPNTNEDIGTGETYTTVNSWLAGFSDKDITDEGIFTGRCKGEEFDEEFDFTGFTTDSTHYLHVTAKSGAEHDGRAHEVSAAGNARILGNASADVIDIADEYVRVSWLEIEVDNSNAQHAIHIGSVTACDVYIHHNVIHSNHTSSWAYALIQCGDWDPAIKAYRNIIYGGSAGGIHTAQGGSGSAALMNTIYESNDSNNASYGGLRTSDTSFEIKGNLCLDNDQKDINGTAGTLDYNATSDTTGDDEGANGVADLTTADQVENPTTTWANTDLRHKSGASIIGGMGATTFSTATYPEIDVAIRSGATRATITGNWDIGADQFPAATGVPWADHHYRMRRAG